MAVLYFLHMPQRPRGSEIGDPAADSLQRLAAALRGMVELRWNLTYINSRACGQFDQHCQIRSRIPKITEHDFFCCAVFLFLVGVA